MVGGTVYDCGVLMCGGCRLQKLLQNIMAESHNKTLIFVETKRKADELHRRMQRDGLVSVNQCHTVVAVKSHCFIATALCIISINAVETLC